MTFNSFAEHRKRAGLTQKQVGDYIGISPQAISKWETGQSEPDIDTLRKLASLYSVTVDELVGKHIETGDATLAEESITKIDILKQTVKKHKFKILCILAAVIVIITAVIVVCMVDFEKNYNEEYEKNYNEEYEKTVFEKYETIELGMTLDEVKSILGKPEETLEEYFEEDDVFGAALALNEYGYYNADFWYYRGAEYDDNVKADMDFDYNYEFKPFYQLRVTFQEGKVVETYFNSQAQYFSILDDYGGGDDKTMKSIEYLDDEYAEIYFEDGSVYLGAVEILNDGDKKYIDHRWGEIIID